VSDRSFLPGEQRPLFELPEGIAYLNVANLAPQLHSVRAAGEAALDRRGAPWTIGAEDWFTDVERLRGLFARVVGTDPEGVALIPASSYGMAVAAANLAGRTLTDLILGRSTALTALPWVGHRVRRWEPEPLRWLGVRGLYVAYRAADRAEHRGRPTTSPLARIADVVSGRH